MARNCVICGKEFFHSKLRKVTCGLSCMQKYNHLTHREQRLLCMKEYYQRNKDRKREYYAEHKDERLSYAKAYRESRREQLRINARKYRKKKNDTN